MARVRLIIWNEEEARERAAQLRKAGHAVDAQVIRDSSIVPALTAFKPDVIVIDLGRAPGRGRDVAYGIRARKALRTVPVVFIGAADRLPPGTPATWDAIEPALRQALAAPPDPVQVRSALDAYKGSPLHKKLGIAPHMRVALWNAPKAFFTALGSIPEGVEFTEDRGDLTIFFAEDLPSLEAHLYTLVSRVPVWIAWPKNTKSNLKLPAVREIALAHGLVDYKICSIDRTWSAMLFTRRKRTA